MIYRDTPTYGWVCGWMFGSVGQWLGLGQITKSLINLDLIDLTNLIKFELIDIICFCLKIPMGGLVG